MDSKSQFDTSGCVACLYQTPGGGQDTTYVSWVDLSPFERGYIDAMFAGPRDWPGKDFVAFKARGMRPLGFSDLAAKTLARIIEDCGEAIIQWPQGYQKGAEQDGRRFWLLRQEPERIDAGRALFTTLFPPLLPTLDDDGKVCF